MNNPSLKKVLIIDDDRINIYALSAVLTDYGFAVATAPDACKAVHILESDASIAIVLTDIMMPDMDGFDFIRMIRNNSLFKHIPLVAVTAQAMAGDREKCLMAGADHYISKPIDADKLLEILRAYEITGTDHTHK